MSIAAREKYERSAHAAFIKAQKLFDQMNNQTSKAERLKLTNDVQHAKKALDAYFVTPEDCALMILEGVYKSFSQVCTTSKKFTTYELAKKYARSCGRQFVIKCPLCAHFHMEQINHEFAVSTEAKLVKLFTHYAVQFIITEETKNRLFRQIENAFIDYGRIYYSWALPEPEVTKTVRNRKGKKTVVVKRPSVKRKLKLADAVKIVDTISVTKNLRVSKVSLEGISVELLTEFYRCGRKRYFALESEAQAATMEAQKDRLRHSVDGVLMEPEMTCYSCNYCTGYHLGHKSPAPHQDPTFERLVETWNLYASRNERFLSENNIPVVWK